MADRRPIGPSSTRLWGTLLETSRFGATAGGGLHRLALGVDDGAVRAWLTSVAEQAGWGHVTDRIGNRFLLRPGVDPAAGTVLVGSHLDSQPDGGRFDGVYGVLAAVEVLRALDDARVTTRRTIVVADWTNEEGARFAPSMMGSAVYAGALALEDALARTDGDGVSVEEALHAIGAVGESLPDDLRIGNVHAAVEVHIEQGPVLEAEHVDVGFVTGVQAIRWLDVTVTGFSGHAGTTPLPDRRDALVGAARIIAAVADLGAIVHPDIRSTVGEVVTAPNSRNVVPGRVRLGIDLRHPDVRVLDAAEAVIRERAAALTPAGFVVEVDVVLQQPAVDFDAELLTTVRSSASALGLSGRDIRSGAGHDAMQLAPLARTAMLFIPCVGGVSHREDERITEQWSSNGVRLLFDVVLRLAEDRAHEGDR